MPKFLALILLFTFSALAENSEVPNTPSASGCTSIDVGGCYKDRQETVEPPGNLKTINAMNSNLVQLAKAFDIEAYFIRKEKNYCPPCPKGALCEICPPPYSAIFCDENISAEAAIDIRVDCFKTFGIPINAENHVNYEGQQIIPGQKYQLKVRAKLLDKLKFYEILEVK